MHRCVWSETQESKSVGAGVYKEVWERASVEMKEAQRDSCMTPSPPRQICHFWL